MKSKVVFEHIVQDLQRLMKLDEEDWLIAPRGWVPSLPEDLRCSLEDLAISETTMRDRASESSPQRGGACSA
jgi:hypothetical protein